MFSGITCLGLPASVMFSAPPPHRDLNDSDPYSPDPDEPWKERVYVARAGVTPVPSSELKGEQ